MVVASRAEVEGSPRELRRPRLTLLVHGYRTDEARAEKGYVAFERRLREAGISGATLGSVWHVHWPADHRRTLVAWLSYSARVPVAEAAGRRLKDLLATLSTAQEVRLVGHSLGCRLVLETVRYVREDPGYDGARIATVVLLAAAVPQLLCTHAPYPFPAPADASEQHVFFSPRDEALGLAFNLGQRFYGEPGDAVGRRGQPGGRWHSSSDTGLRHGAYWGARTVAQQVSNQLAGRAHAGPPATRSLASLPPPARQIDARAVPRRLPLRRPNP